MTYFTSGVQLNAAIEALPASKKGGFKAFDPFFYGQKYIVNGNYTGTLTPIEHFVQIGADLGNSPSAQFDPVYYKATYPDLASSSLNAADLLYHFLMFGLDEGRAPNATLAGFNGAQYLANNADVAEYVNANLDQFGNNAQNGALAHYVKFGQFETRPGDVDSGMGGTFRLTVSDDIVDGTANNDTFKANVLQNPNGQQVNSLGSGDEISGGAGVDTLMAKVTAGAFVAGNYTMPIQPETTSVEIVKLEAVNSGIYVAPQPDTPSQGGPSGPAITDVYINAKDMSGVTQLWSSRSDANLVVQNMTTKGLTQLSDMTIGMEYTGNADSAWTESNMTVYFDQDYLTPEVSNSASVDIRLMNQSAYDVNPLTALGIDSSTGAIGPTVISSFKFTVGANQYDMAGLLNTVDPINSLLTYADALEAIKAALVSLKALYPADALLQTVNAELGGTFFADIPNDPVSGLPTGAAREGIKIILSAAGTTNLTMDSLLLSPVNQTQTSMNLFNESRLIDGTSDSSLAINVALEKVGLAGDGGTLIIGSMNKTSANEWNAVNTTTDITTSGINEFNVTVYGAQDKSSSLAGLHSTNNNLRVVNVVTDAALAGTSFADLTIGNSNTTGTGTALQFEDFAYVVDRPDAFNANALKDVQTFNAAGLKGDLTLYAALTQEVTSKYLEVDDNAANETSDNDNFAYTSGSGNDYINLFLDPANLAEPGVVTREDMTLTVNTGAGDDEVLVSTGVFSGEDFGSASSPAWYNNQSINANLKMAGGVATGQLQINTGDGADIVRTLGTGDYAINGGTGNDTVYADNSGDRAFWTINDLGGSINNLVSRPAVPAATKIANLFLNVSFKGFDAKVSVGGSNNSNAGVSITDMTINQAIKDAINNDPVLNKLLSVADGPGRTLVVTSLIDGAQSGLDDIDDIVFSLSSTPLTATQLLNAAPLSALQAQALGFGDGSAAATYVANGGDRFDANDTGNGGNSDAVSDNLIVGGTGDDVLVLGTGQYSNDTVGYAGFANGRDTIVNFESTSVVTTTVDYAAYVYTQGAAAAPAVVVTTNEQAIVEFTNATAAGTIVFDGETINIAGGETAAQVAALVAAGTFTNYVAVAGAGGLVTFTATPANAGADLPNIETTDFAVSGTTITPSVSGVVLGVVSNADGSTTITTPAVLAQTEGFTVTFADAAAASAYTFDGESIPVLAGELGTDIAAAVATGVYANWTVTNLTGNAVTFASTTPNANVADAAEFGGVAANLVTTALTVTTSSDVLDFSSYNAEAVYVNGVMITSGPAATLGQTYITLVESTTNDGEYTMTQWTEAGAVDTVVGIIGIADFGREQAFDAANFVI